MATEPAFFEAVPSGGLVGQSLRRVDGRAKVTGQATYAAEHNHLPGLVHAVFRTSDVAHGRLTALETSAAQQAPGVLAVLTHLNLPALAHLPTTPAEVRALGLSVQMSFLPLTSDQIFYAGQPVALVIAGTLEQAQYAATLLQVGVATAPPLASYQDPRATMIKPTQGWTAQLPPARGNAEADFASAPVQLTATYTHATNHHQPLEPGATIAHWETPSRLTVYDATQGIFWTRQALSALLGLPQDQVRVVSKYIGGGFGCKGSVWPHTLLAALAARAVSRPVKLVLTREQMFTGMGQREDQQQTLRLGASKEGKLLALLHEKTSTTSPWDDFAEPANKLVSLLYACPAFEARTQMARANVMTSTYMRAPGEAPGSFAIECSMDDLAYRLGLDPLQIRLLNYADVNPSSGQPWSSKSLKECYRRGAELFGWDQRNPQAGQTRQGKVLVGYGMATASYPVNGGQGRARVRLYADGHAVVQAGATDLGTGMYTVLTQVAAEVLGLPAEKVRVELGDSELPTTVASAGSAGAGTVSSSVYLAAQDVRRQLTALAVVDARSPLYRAQPVDVAVVHGCLQLKANPAKGDAVADVLRRAGLSDLEGLAMGRYGADYESAQTAASVNPEQQRDQAPTHSMHSFGAHFCEVHVDPELGTVRVKRWVSVVAGGRILNPQTARSQIMGGAVMGIGAALLEESVRDPHLARYTNANLAGYHVPVQADIPDMQVEFVAEHDPYINAMGVKGIGEIAIVGTAAAVANAIFHATGRRLRSLPVTPDKVLAALRAPA